MLCKALSGSSTEEERRQAKCLGLLLWEWWHLMWQLLTWRSENYQCRAKFMVNNPTWTLFLGDSWFLSTPWLYCRLLYKRHIPLMTPCAPQLTNWPTAAIQHHHGWTSYCSILILTFNNVYIPFRPHRALQFVHLLPWILYMSRGLYLPGVPRCALSVHTGRRGGNGLWKQHGSPLYHRSTAWADTFFLSSLSSVFIAGLGGQLVVLH